MLVLALCWLATVLITAGAPAAGLPRLIRSPYDVHLISASIVGGPPVRASRSPVQVVIRTRSRIAGLTVAVNRRRVPRGGAIRRGNLRWRVSVPTRLLRAGANKIVITGRTGRASGIAVVFFRYLRPARGLVRVLSPTRGATVSSAVRVRLSLARGAAVRGWLNGRPLAAELGWPQRTRSRGQVTVRFDLGAAHGLRFGSNTLVVQGERGRSYTRVTRTVHVSRGAPLVGAGVSRLTTVRRAVVLGSRAIQASRAGALRYGWRIIRAPRSSRARVGSPRARQRVFRPDVPGVYVLRQTVRESGVRAGSEDVTVTATAIDPLVRLTTEHPGPGNSFGVCLSPTCYQGPADPLQVYVFDRHTIQSRPIINGFTSASDLNSWLAAESMSLDTPIVIIQTTPVGTLTDGTDTVQFNAALAQIGARPGWSVGTSLPTSFVAVGVLGQVGSAPIGSATQSCVAASANAAPACDTAPTTPLDGWFSSPTADPHYTFSPGQYVPFSVQPTPANAGQQQLTNTITVGTTSIAAPPFGSAAVGGFHVVVVDRYTLSVLANRSFSTNIPSDPQAAAVAQGQMAALLDSAVANAPQLVLLTTVGQPFDPASRAPASWTKVLQDVGALGGTEDVFAHVQGSATYSLVGTAHNVDYGHVAEASTVAHPPGTRAVSGAIGGVLERNHDYMFQSLLSSPSMPAVGLYAAIYQPATAWPDSQRTDYAAASLYFSEQLLGTHCNGQPCYRDVRDAYSSITAVGAWGDLLSRLSRMTYPGSAAHFSEATFQALKDDYGGGTGQNPGPGEFTMVDTVNTFLLQTIQQPFVASGLADYINFRALAMTIENAVQPPPDDSTLSDVLAIIQGGIDIASGGASESLEAALTTLSGGFGVAAGLTSDDGSGDPVQATIQTTAADLAKDIVDRENEILASFDTLDELALGDYGRLTAANNAISSLNLQPTDISNLSAALQAGARQQIATALVRINWTLSSSDQLNNPPMYYTRPNDQQHVNGVTSPLTDVRLWQCNAVFSIRHPYAKLPASTQYTSIVGWNAIDGSPLYRVTLIIGAEDENEAFYGGKPTQCEFDWPKQDFANGPVFDALFAPAAANVPGTGHFRPRVLPRMVVGTQHERCPVLARQREVGP